jgi:hypothetical protein
VFGGSPEAVPKEDQYLSIMPSDGASLGFTYQQMKLDLQKCLEEVKKESPSTDEEIEELKDYIHAFLHEVETGERV